MRNVDELGKEYILSAERIKTKIDNLKELKGHTQIIEQRELEERIVLLEAQHSYLVSTAVYLENYYAPTKF